MRQRLAFCGLSVVLDGCNNTVAMNKVLDVTTRCVIAVKSEKKEQQRE